MSDLKSVPVGEMEATPERQLIIEHTIRRISEWIKDQKINTFGQNYGLSVDEVKGFNAACNVIAKNMLDKIEFMGKEKQFDD